MNSPTILVVEDDHGVLSVCRIALERAGYDVLAAASAEEALRLADASRAIDVILVDIALPDRSGLELARRLVKSGITARVICMSGYPLPYVPDRYLQAEAPYYFLPKPFTPDQLTAIVITVLAT